MTASKRSNAHDNSNTGSAMSSSTGDDTTPSESPPPQPGAADAEDVQQGGAASGEADRAERIRQAAYALSQQRGFEPGRDVDDWLAAEREVDEGGRGVAR